MLNLSDLLNEAIGQDDAFLMSSPLHIVSESSASGWMQEVTRQIKAVASDHEAWLKKQTGRNWKLFKSFVIDNGRLVARFDPSKRGLGKFGPMVVLRTTYTSSSDLYNITIEVYAEDISKMLASHEIAGVSTNMLEDPAALYSEVQYALLKLNPKLSQEATAVDVGPAAERSKVLAQAKSGVDKMIATMEIVRGWVKSLDLGDKDKTGAAVAALKLAKQEMMKSENSEMKLSDLIELHSKEHVPGTRIESIEAAYAYVVEKKSDPSPEARKAKEGLSRMVDGLRQLQGMLRQAKMSSRIVDQVEAAIAGMKSTRDAIDAMFEDVASPVPSVDPHFPGEATPVSPSSPMYPTHGVLMFKRTKASEVQKGMWLRGGTHSNAINREVVKVSRSTDDMSFVVFGFEAPYVSSSGETRWSVTFHKDSFVLACRATE